MNEKKIQQTNEVADKIFVYDDYRKFLHDYFQEQKNIKAFFSYRYFARRAGFVSASFCSHVIKGKRNLSEKSLEKIALAIGLKSRTAKYFEALVKYNQSGDDFEREKYYKEIVRLRRSSGFYTLATGQLEFMRDWYNPVIRELATKNNWAGDFKKLASMVVPKITEAQAKQSVEMLLKCDLLKFDNGEYKLSEPVITADKMPSHVNRNMLKQFIQKGIESFENVEPAKRYIASATVGVTKRQMDEIKEMMEELRRRVLAISAENEKSDEIYHLNLTFFPLSNAMSLGRER